MTKFGVSLRILLLILGLVSTATALAKSSDGPPGFADFHTTLPGAPEDWWGIFILPNEDTPIKGKDIYGSLGPGVLISVGSERGPIALTLAPNVTHLLQVDRDPGIVLYNRLNIILLKAAARASGSIRDRMSLYTTWKFNPQDFVDKLPDLKISEDEKSFARANMSSNWWKQLARRLKSNNFHSPEDKPSEFGGPIQFAGVKYWREEKQMSRLFAMADEDRMQAELLDLTDEMALGLLKDSLDQKGLKISGVDTSNAWFSAGAKLRTTIRTLSPNSEKTLFIFTWLLGPKGEKRREYTGLTAKNLEQSGFMVEGDIQKAYGNLCETLLKN